MEADYGGCRADRTHLDAIDGASSPGLATRAYVLVQGDFGTCHLLVNFCQKQGLVPVYGTTAREAVEQVEPGGTVHIQHRFRHRRFKVYGR